MDQFKRGDMVVRKATCGKQTTIELYEQYHKYHGCLGMVIRTKLQRPNQRKPPPDDQREKMYQVRWFTPCPSNQQLNDDHWYADYQIGHLDGRHRWK